MSDERKADGQRLSEDREGPLGEQGWHAGATFFEESGGRPAQASGGGAGERGGGDPHLPASESGTGIIPEDERGAADDVHRPASEAGSESIKGESEGETQSWPGSSFGSIPPPG